MIGLLIFSSYFHIYFDNFMLILPEQSLVQDRRHTDQCHRPPF